MSSGPSRLFHSNRFDPFRYALDIDLPEFVVTDPIIMALNQSTNDLVTWSNVRLSLFRTLVLILTDIL